MPKISYMVTDEYVRDWKRIHALREIISNGIDAEIEKRATLNVRHDSRTQKLYVRNDRTKLDVKALYFGGTTKADDDRLVGQYGEGLKLAMLVLAREKVPLRIHNCDEDWDVKIEPDERGVKVLTLYTRRSRNPDDCVEVEIGDVNNDLWYEARSMFLRLAPPLESFDTSYGQILPEVDQVGKVYVKGVLVGEFPKSAFGYNFRDLDVGRDRVSFDQSSAQTRIARMWEEAATSDGLLPQAGMSSSSATWWRSCASAAAAASRSLVAGAASSCPTRSRCWRRRACASSAPRTASAWASSA
jgi:hypothetical protein